MLNREYGGSDWTPCESAKSLSVVTDLLRLYRGCLNTKAKKSWKDTVYELERQTRELTFSELNSVGLISDQSLEAHKEWIRQGLDSNDKNIGIVTMEICQECPYRTHGKYSSN